jgi:UDP-N-acetylmuramate dehydrogenase
LPQIANYINNGQPQFFVLGGGSNIILPEIYQGLVIHNQLLGIHIVEDTANYVVVRAAAGENWDSFVLYTLNNGWFGLENLSLIPGTVGASPIQNIGAYGVEVKDFIQSVEVFDIETRETKIIDKDKCNFSYRNSMFKTQHNYIVTNVTFRLSKTPHLNTKYGDLAHKLAEISNPTPLDLRNCVIEIRSGKLPDPKLIANVGSFFHNPIVDNTHAKLLLDKYPKLPVFAVDDTHSKVSAGWMIDNLGLKGYQIGNMGVYDKQALVLVNHANADKTEALNFANFIQNKVWQEYGIKINIEPIII